MNQKVVIGKYVAFLRGINVGGHHKVPMAELRKALEKLNYNNVVTLLNSGNVIFESSNNDLCEIEQSISTHLEKTFGFTIPTLIRTSEMIHDMVNEDPFKNEILTKDSRWYVSLLRNDPKTELKLPWSSEDGSFKIIEIKQKAIYSILDISISKTPKGMDALEQLFGKGITTRNWNTINRIKLKLDS